MTNEKQRRKDLGKQYVQTHRAMGVYQVKNKVSGKVLVGSTMDLNGMFNRFVFSLNMGVNLHKELQADWKVHGEQQFAFDILEQIKPQEELIQSFDELDKYKQELEIMEQMWIEELQPFDERGYNKKPKKKD